MQGVVPSGNRERPAPGGAAAARRQPDDRRRRLLVVHALPTPESWPTLMREVDAHSLRLDTALVFDEIRTMATADERQRLAREIHDGIAQEVASLGYVVDHMASTTRDPDGRAGPARPPRRAVPGGRRPAAVDLRPAQRRLGHQRSRLGAVGLRPAGRREVRPHRAPDPQRGAHPALARGRGASCCASPRRRSPTPASTPSARNLWVDCWTDPPLRELVGPRRRPGHHRRAATTPTASRSCASAPSASTPRSKSPASPSGRSPRGTVGTG